MFVLIGGSALHELLTNQRKSLAAWNKLTMQSLAAWLTPRNKLKCLQITIFREKTSSTLAGFHAGPLSRHAGPLSGHAGPLSGQIGIKLFN